MSKISVVCLAVIALTPGFISAETGSSRFGNYDGDDAWNNPANWDAGVPDHQCGAVIYETHTDSGGRYCRISEAMPDGVCAWLAIGSQNDSIPASDWDEFYDDPAVPHVRVTGGRLNIYAPETPLGEEGKLYIGKGADGGDPLFVAGPGIMTVTGGDIDCRDLYIGGANRGLMKITGGTVRCRRYISMGFQSDGTPGPGGAVFLLGGTLHVDGDQGIDISETGRLFIGHGTMYFNAQGDPGRAKEIVVKLSGYIASKRIAGYYGNEVLVYHDPGLGRVVLRSGSADFNFDGIVNLEDLAIMASEWIN